MKISKQLVLIAKKTNRNNEGRKKLCSFLVRLFKSLSARPKCFPAEEKDGEKLGVRFSFENSSSRHFPRDNTKFLRSRKRGDEKEEIRQRFGTESGLVSFDFRLSSSPMAERTAKERQRERSNLHFSFLSFFRPFPLPLSSFFFFLFFFFFRLPLSFCHVSKRITNQ